MRDSMPEISPEVPERVVALVQEMLGAMQRRNSLTSTPPGSASVEEKAKTVVLNIWDFAGQAVYYTTHQVMRDEDRVKRNVCVRVSGGGGGGGGARVHIR